MTRVAPGDLGDQEEVQRFLALSSALTGFSAFELLATAQVERYLQIAKSRVGPMVWRSLMKLAASLAPLTPSARGAAVELKIYRVDEVRLAAQRLILLWYTGTWFDTLPFGGVPAAPESYVEGLVWRAIAAHPMAAKPQGFGAWAAAPPRDPLESHDAR